MLSLNEIIKPLFLGIILCFFTVAFAENASDDNTGRDDAQIYNLYQGVDLVTTMKFQYGNKPKLFVKLVYPVLDSDIDNAGVNMFNQQVNELLTKEIDDFKQQAITNQKDFLDSKSTKNNLYIDYDASFIRSGHNHILSVRFTLQGYLAGMAHPFHRHRVINFNLDAEQNVSLSDLFETDSDYLTMLEAYSRYILGRRLRDIDMIKTGTQANAQNFRNFNIKPNGLLITFDESQVAAYVDGAQTVLVPYTVLKHILAKDSPISSCVKDKRVCAHSNVLVGGFIDEAFNTLHRPLNPILSQL